MSPAFKVLFQTLGGDLHRKSDGVKVRHNYEWHFARPKTAREVAACLRAGRFAWPGGYPCYFVTQDGAALCFECVQKEWRQVVWDFVRKASTGWRVAACEVNWEDGELTCEHCSKRIESAYAD